MLRLLSYSVVCSLALCFSTLAGDWPQILGPERAGIATGENLTDVWSNERAEKVGAFPLGSGFAGVAVRDGIAIVFHRIDNQEVVERIELKSKSKWWRKEFPTSYRASVVSNDGPLCVPTIAGNRVVVLGASGGLRCLDLGSGKVLWSHELAKLYSFSEGYFGCGSAPLIHNGLVIVNVGAARDDAGVVAFDSKSGEVRWEATAESASYAAPIIVMLEEKPYALVVCRLNTVLLDLENGNVQWSIPFGQRGPTVNGASPILLDANRFLLTASYGIGMQVVEFDADSARVVNAGQKLSSQYTTPILHQGYVWGIDGRQDGGPVNLVCLDANTLEVISSVPNFGYATLMLADDRLLAMKTDGELVVGKPNPKGFAEIARLTLTDRTVRALPALADGYFVIRDTQSLLWFDFDKK